MERKIKQVILVRRDLNMRTGKSCAMVAHASLAVFLNKNVSLNQRKLSIHLTEDEAEWTHGYFTKIVLGVETEAELLEAYELAKLAGLNTSLITDCGATEFHGVKTNTAVAIGPNESSEIDLITGTNGKIKTKLI